MMVAKGYVITTAKIHQKGKIFSLLKMSSTTDDQLENSGTHFGKKSKKEAKRVKNRSQKAHILACLEFNDGSKWIKLSHEESSKDNFYMKSRDFDQKLAQSNENIQNMIKNLTQNQNMAALNGEKSDAKNNGVWISYENFLRNYKQLKIVPINEFTQWNALTVTSPCEEDLSHAKIGIVKIKIWKSGEYTFTLQ